ncbi:MAG: hypothetical protein EBU33_00555 [Sphingobacteriia bacterium]|jgi:hypothetical protein|nr:hypothetical protein [Sphingobacteriia bacterium]
MKLKIPYLFLLVCFFTTSHAQKLGAKVVLDQGKNYTSANGSAFSSKWNSKSYGLSYEKPLSEKFLLTLETGFYLNFKNNKKQEGYIKGYTQSGYFSNATDTVFKSYNKVEKIREIHLPILVKKYFHIGKSIFFISWGPKLALTLSDNIHYKETIAKTFLKENLLLNSENKRLYLYNNSINIGYEHKQIQFSLAIAPSSSSNSNRVNYNSWLNNSYLFSFSLGYMF